MARKDISVTKNKIGKYRTWVVDFDGTLVNSSFKYSSAVKNSIKLLLEKDCDFCIATGRPYFGLIRQTCKELKLTSPQIISGGSGIIDPNSEKLLWKKLISARTVQKLLELFERKSYSFSVASDKHVFSPEAKFFREYGPEIEFKDTRDLDMQNVFKIVVNDTTGDNILKVGDKLSHEYPELHIVRSGINRIVLDITSKKGTKHSAVLELAKILKVSQSKIVGVGDGYNDYPLLTSCGFKIAMDNAPSQLKKIADLIVPPVTEDGLVNALTKTINA